MEDKKVVVNINGPIDQEKPIVIVIREGEAEPIKDLFKAFAWEVSLVSIADFLEKRRVPTPIEDNPGVIAFSLDPRGPYLKYFENPINKEAISLTAKMEESEDLTAFGINRDQKFNQASLAKLIRTKAHCFPTQDVAKALIQSLNNFEVRFETIIAKNDDRQGNKVDLVNEALKLTKGELPKELHLVLPFFENTAPIDITLEIEIDRGGDNKPLFSFYSMDLEIKKREVIAKEIGDQVARLKDRFAVVEQ